MNLFLNRGCRRRSFPRGGYSGEVSAPCIWADVMEKVAAPLVGTGVEESLYPRISSGRRTLEYCLKGEGGAP